MNITKTIVNGISIYIFKFSEQISEKYKIPLEEILKIWCEQQDISYESEFAQMVKLSKKQQKKSIVSNGVEHSNESTKSTESSTNDSSVADAKLCEYTFTKGSKKGQRCTTMAKNGSLCSKHKAK